MSGNNDITELRSHLFDALRSLQNTEAPMELDRAKAICEVGQTIINSAKVEVDHLKVTNGIGVKPSGFLGGIEGGGTKQIESGTKTVTVENGQKVTRHECR